MRARGDIAKSVYEGLEARHPRLFAKLGRTSIIARVIINSRRDREPVPVPLEDGPPSSGSAPAGRPNPAVDEVQLAADRLRRLREREQF